MRKPGEPIYLRKHMLALTCVVLATIVIPRLYELVAGPLTFGARFLSGMLIGVTGGAWLYFIFRMSAENEPENKEK